MDRFILKSVIKKAAVVAATVGMVAGCSSPSDSASDSITLRLTDFFPSQHFVEVNGVLPFMDKVEELSHGEISFEHYPGGQLVADADSVSGAESGLTDIAYFTLPYSAEDLPLLSVCSLPNAFKTSAQGISACDEVLDTPQGQATFDNLGVHYLWGFMMPPYTIQTSDTAVETMADLHGLKVQSSGGVYSDTLKALGAVPVEMSAGDIYESVDRGTIDGSNLNILSVTGYGLAPLLRHNITGTDTGSLLSGFIVNDKVWDQLSPEHQKILQTASAQQQKELTSWLDENIGNQATELKDEGSQFHEFKEQDAWADAVAPVWDEWVTKMDHRGLDGQAIMDAWKRGLRDAGATQ